MCAAEFDEATLAWMCGQCEHKPLQDLHPYTLKLLRVLMLQEAGYPLQANDLELEEWEDLGRVKTALKQRELDHAGTDHTTGH